MANDILEADNSASSKSDKIEAVVFDMDGVIFDSERISLEAWKMAGQEIGFDRAEEAHRECTGLSRKDAYAKLTELYGPDFPSREFRERSSVLFSQLVEKNGLPLMHYAEEILRYLKDKKYPLALASSTRREVVLKEIQGAGLYGYFDYIICGDQVTHSKPDPQIYLLSCQALNVNPRNALAVEDSINGILSAYRAGMKCLMVPDQIQPDEKIKSILYRLCDSLENIKDFL